MAGDRWTHRWMKRRIPVNVATPRALEDVMGSKRDSKGTRGPALLGGQRTEFARLISIEVSNSEACRRVGVNRRTGTRWRLGRRVVLASGAVLEWQTSVVRRRRSPGRGEISRAFSPPHRSTSR
jgi:hypothetical protein